MPQTLDPKLPYSPLERFVTNRVRARMEHICPMTGQDRMMVALADYMGVPREYMYRLREAGTLTLQLAEDIASHLDVHPISIWGDEYERAADELVARYEATEAWLRRKRDRQAQEALRRRHRLLDQLIFQATNDAEIYEEAYT